MVDLDQELGEEVIPSEDRHADGAEGRRQENFSPGDCCPEGLARAIVDGQAIARVDLTLLTLLEVDAKRDGELLGEARAVSAAIDKRPDGKLGPITTLKENLYCWVESGTVPKGRVGELRRSSLRSAPRRLRGCGRVLRG